MITYFRLGRLQKFFIADESKGSHEIDFMKTAKLFECDPKTKKQEIPNKMFDLLKLNKDSFSEIIIDDSQDVIGKVGRDNGTQILKVLKITQQSSQQLTDDQEFYLKKVITQINEGGIPKKTLKDTLQGLKNLEDEISNSFKVVGVLQSNISDRLLDNHYEEVNDVSSGKREVILSLYLTDD